jgi:NTP pyrophosphatase (non-canonical NTP hydrolase)
MSVAIEAAEVLEHFQFDEEPRDRAALAGELADVANYLLQLAYLTGIDLEQAILDKLQENYGRTWARS